MLNETRITMFCAILFNFQEYRYLNVNELRVKNIDH